MLELLKISYGILVTIFIITYVIMIIINRMKIKDFKHATIFNGVWAVLALIFSIITIVIPAVKGNWVILLIFMILTIINYILLIRDYYPIIKSTKNHKDRTFENMEIRLFLMMFIMIFVPVLGNL